MTAGLVKRKYFAIVLAVVCLLLIAAGRYSTGPLGACAGLVGATISLAILPGYLLCSALRLGNDDLPLQWMVAAGFSLIFIQAVCLLGLSLHLSLGAVALGVLALVTLGAVVQAIAGSEDALDLRQANKAYSLPMMAIAAWGICAGLAYLVGHHDVDIQLENLLAIGIADALMTARTPQEAFFTHGVNPIYPFPGSQYFFALVTYLSGTTNIFVFDKMRFFWTATSLSTVFVGIRAICGTSTIAYLGLIGSSILVINGQLGIVPDYNWGQLATTSHPADIAMNIFVPIALAALLQWLSPFSAPRPFWLWLFSGMALVLSAVHQREVVQLVIYAGCAFLVLRGWRLRIVLAVATFLPVCGVLAFRLWSTIQSSGMEALLVASRSRLTEEFNALDLWAALKPARMIHAYAPTFLQCLNPFMLLAASAVVFVYSRFTGLRSAALAMAFFLVASSFAVIAIPLLWMTYDELLYVPIRYVVFIMYVAFWIGVGVLLDRLVGELQNQLNRVLIMAIAAIAALACAGVANVLTRGIIPAEILALTAAVLAGGALLPLGRYRSTMMFPGERTVTSAALAFVIPFALLTALPVRSFYTVLKTGSFSLTPAATLKDAYVHSVRSLSGTAGTCKTETAELWDRRLAVDGCSPPLDVVEAVYPLVPRDGVLLMNSFNNFIPTGILPIRQAVPAQPWAFFRNWDKFFSRYAQLSERTLLAYGGMPFFATSEPLERRYGDARDLGATHVLLNPVDRSVIMDSVAQRPDLFRVVFDRSQWVLLAVLPEANASPSR